MRMNFREMLLAQKLFGGSGGSGGSGGLTISISAGSPSKETTIVSIQDDITIICPNAERIADNAFSSLNNLKEVSLPNALYINDYAFSNCTNLTKVDAPVCGTFYEGAFNNCKSLKDINAPKLATVSDFALYGTAIETFDVDKSMLSRSMLSIGAYAFGNCKSLKRFLSASTILVDDGISESAFIGCESLEKIPTLETNVIGSYAFSECSSLKEVCVLGVTYDSEINICEGAFSGCTSLEKVILGASHDGTDGRIDIGADAFSNSGVTALILDRCVVSIVDFTALIGTPIMAGQGHIYVPTVVYEYYRAGYEEPLNAAMGAGAFDFLFRKIEDYPEICG